MKRLLSSLLLGLVATLLVTVPVLAYLYRGAYTVVESDGNSYDMLAVSANASNQWMASNGFMASSANDTRIQTLGGLNKPHMVADNKTLTAVPVSANSQTNLYFVTGESAQDMDIIVGYSANTSVGYIEVIDAANLEMLGSFELEINGWWNTDNGTDKNAVIKTNAFKLFVSPTVSGNITATINGGASVSALNVASGNHAVKVVTDGFTLWIYVDGVEKDSSAMSGNVTDNGNDWVFMQNNVLIYAKHIKLWTSE